MKLFFPRHFEFGTSTAASQIETSFQHDWEGHIARDGHVFAATTAHELVYEQDIDIITSLAPCYRMSLQWSRLQRAPGERFHEDTVAEYKSLLTALTSRGTKVMMVLHHFTNPVWFAKMGGWERKENIFLWLNFVGQMVDTFGPYVSSWNTFNEPNLYATMGWISREFPPYKSNLVTARTVIKNIAEAHHHAYQYIKSQFPSSPVGMSHNCTLLEADNIAGILPAKVADFLYMEYPPSLFTDIDFFGMSYYARIGYDPLPTTYILTPEKLKRKNKPHDDMWEYYPDGLEICLKRYWKQYQKPIVITENGICTTDDELRIKALKDYLKIVHKAIDEGIDVRGYYHWSTWDNFEWSLGPSYHFGLYKNVEGSTARMKKPSADFYAGIAFTNTLNLSPIRQ